MGRILSYVMFGFFVCTTIMSASVLRSREKLKINNILFALVCIGSSIWSFCFGFIWIQTDPLRAYYWRCAGMVGTFMYMICAMLVIARWCGQKRLWISAIKGFVFFGNFAISVFNAEKQYCISYVCNRYDICVCSGNMEHII